MRAEELKGHLDGLLLATLEDGPCHGYAIIEALRQATGGQLDMATGTIYPALRLLEQSGLIAGSWLVVGGRRRREYRLTRRRRRLGGQAVGVAQLCRHDQRRAGRQAMAESSVIADYLTALSAQLPGPIVEELADGLDQTRQRYLDQGLQPEPAAEAALAEFGEAQVIVAAFARGRLHAPCCPQNPGHRTCRRRVLGDSANHESRLVVASPGRGSPAARRSTRPHYRPARCRRIRDEIPVDPMGGNRGMRRHHRAGRHDAPGRCPRHPSCRLAVARGCGSKLGPAHLDRPGSTAGHDRLISGVLHGLAEPGR